MTAITQLLFRGWDLLHYLSGGGSWALRPYERTIVDAVIDSFSQSIQALLLAQLQQKYFVERIPAGRINVFRFYNPDGALKIQDAKFSDLLMNVQIDVDGEEQVAHATFYKGYIFSIEFKKPGRYYSGKKVTVRDVRPGKPNQTYTRAIDRFEHGRDS